MRRNTKTYRLIERLRAKKPKDFTWLAIRKRASVKVARNVVKFLKSNGEIYAECRGHCKPVVYRWVV